MGILGGLGAALGWGVANYFAREAGVREGSLKALLYLQLVGTPAAALLLFLAEGGPSQRTYSLSGLAGVSVSLLMIGGILFLFRALAAGPLLIVTPIANSYAAVAVALSLLSGERPGAVQLVGMGVTLVGVALAAVTSGETTGEAGPDSTQNPRTRLPPGVIYALVAACLWGFGVWLWGFVVEVLGSLTSVFVLRVSGLVFVTAFFLASRRPLRPRSRSSLKWLLPVGLLDTAGNWSFSLGLLSGLTSIVSVMASLSGVVTVVLGYVLAGERVTRIQQVGIVITFVGVALVSV